MGLKYSRYFARAMANPLHLLLADDDLDDCIMFEKALKELPINTHLKTVYDGDDLLKELSGKNSGLPDLIFLDLNMPRINGVECLHIIKTSEELKKIPVIIFSTSIHETLARKLIDKGAKECIQKPSSFRELKNVISNTLSALQ
jgi:CheY-like chemotaxis protein